MICGYGLNHHIDGSELVPDKFIADNQLNSAYKAWARQGQLILTNRCQDAPMLSPFSSSNQLASAYATDTMDPTISMQIPLTTGGQPTTNSISPSNNLTRCQSMPNYSPSNSSLHPTLLKSHKMVTRAHTNCLKPK
ncbi:hypothetical protein H5410_026679 [Solanum commersonii]|uniref:Uncharacterized protein n=1 Tax=Solanum commersonii TaxID=4109 RepID=A0A9J5YWT7_SOLCO|nr:hypothetical protein H5410_026679 [Solanum commersonii]